MFLLIESQIQSSNPKRRSLGGMWPVFVAGIDGMYH